MTFGAPQIILVVLVCVSLGIDLANHGKQKVERENAFTSAFGAAITLALLWWGGFFG